MYLHCNVAVHGQYHDALATTMGQILQVKSLRTVSFNHGTSPHHTMDRPALLLLTMAGILAAGLGLSIYSSMVFFEDIVVVDAMLSRADPVEVSAPIPPGTGVYAINIQDYTDDMKIRAHVQGPLGYTMASVEVETQTIQGIFDVDEQFEYTLVIQTDDTNPVRVTGALGPEPDASRTSLGFVSLYMLVVGVLGMIAATTYLVVKRRRANSGTNPF